MHKHFRMLAIAEHMRSHGYDPAIYTHLRIPGIWKKLNEFFNMPMIDDRENTLDVIQDPSYDDQFKPFDLPWDEYGDLIMQRAIADPNDPPTSPAQLHKSPTSSKKRKRGDPASGHHPKTRSSTVEDSEAENDEDAMEANTNPARKSARSTRSAKRAASKKAEEEENESEEESEGEDGEDSESSEESNSSSEEEELPAAKTTRGPGRGWRRGRARARGGRRR